MRVRRRQTGRSGAAFGPLVGLIQLDHIARWIDNGRLVPEALAMLLLIHRVTVLANGRNGRGVGNDEGTGEWFEVTQDQINQFADVTHDHQFIHVDPEAAKATPFGTTIAMGS